MELFSRPLKSVNCSHHLLHQECKRFSLQDQVSLTNKLKRNAQSIISANIDVTKHLTEVQQEVIGIIKKKN
jgi:hypothetical protein